MPTEKLTTFLAVWGAILSSFAIGWNFYRDLNERGRLRVSCYVGRMFDDVNGLDPNKYLIWNVTNIGRTPVCLTSIGGENNDGTAFIAKNAKVPKILQPGEYVIESMNDFSVLNVKLKALTATDSIGRTFRAPRKQLKKLKNEYKTGVLNKQSDS